MRVFLVATCFLLPIPTACSAQENAADAAAQAASPVLDEAAIFTAAGFHQEDGHWAKCGDPGTVSYTPGAIESPGDLNGDGLPEAVVTEGGSYCFGMTGQGYTLMSQQADGGWKLITENIGVPGFLDSKGADGWPDIEVGGPGFCFPVQRWNGSEYGTDRFEYEGKPCQP